MIHYWKGMGISNLKYGVCRSFDILYFQSKSEVWLNFDNMYFHANFWLKVKNNLTSSVILYWKARLIHNLKFKVAESNVDNLYSHENPQVQSKKIKCYTPVKGSGHGESKT
jgi:hypothetical protein